MDRRGRRRARAVPGDRTRDPRGGPDHDAVTRVEQHGVLHRAARAEFPLGARGFRAGQAEAEHQRVVPRRGGAEGIGARDAHAAADEDGRWRRRHRGLHALPRRHRGHREGSRSRRGGQKNGRRRRRGRGRRQGRDGR